MRRKFGDGDFVAYDGDELRMRIVRSSKLPRRDAFPAIMPWLIPGRIKIFPRRSQESDLKKSAREESLWRRV